jgi:hypothetical protein
VVICGIGLVVVALASLMFYLSSRLTEVEGGKGFNFIVYPWLTTLPETVATALLLIKGLTTAALFNSVFSAVFDLCVVLGLTAIVYGSVEVRGLIDLALGTVLSILAFTFLCFDSVIDIFDSMVLLSILAILSIYAYFLGWGRPRANWLVTLVGLGLSVIPIYFLVEGVEVLSMYISEAYAGVVSAVATSIPDAIIALIYGLRSEEAVSSLLGAIAHDFVENIPIAVLLAYLAGATGGLVIADTARVVGIAGLTTATLLFTFSYGRVDRREGYIMLIIFLVLLLLV